LLVLAAALATGMTAGSGSLLAREADSSGSTEPKVISTQTYPGADAVVVRLDVRTTVAPTGQSTRIEKQAVKLLTPAGVRRYSVLQFDYDPETSRLDVTGVRIVHADGETTTLRPEGLVDVPAPKHGIYWPFRTRLLSVPDLVPGDTVEWSTRFVGYRIAYLDDEDRFTPPQKGEFFDVTVFGSDLPTIEQSHRIDMPAAKPLYFGTYGGPLQSTVTPDGNGGISYLFRATDIPPYPDQAAAPPRTDVATRLVLATLPSWREKSKWVYLVNEPSFAVTPETQALARRLTDGLSSDEARLAALNRWVAHSIRYSGLSMGAGEGYTIHPASMTLADRSGVCKDKAGMLVALMRAAGYSDTFTAITSAGSRVDDIPADQFNHAVVAWRRPGGGYLLLDPTWAPLSRDLWSRAESAQHYLVGTPEGEDLAITPPSRPQDNLLDVDVEETIDSDGALTGTIRVTASGAPEDSLRRTFGFRAMPLWQEAAATLVASFSAAALTAPLALAPQEVQDLDSPFELHISYSDSAALPIPRENPKKHLRLPYRPAVFALFLNDPRMADHLLASNLAGRKVPVQTRSARTLRFEQRTRLPRDARLDAWTDVHVITPQGTVKAAARVDGRLLIVEVTMVFNSRFIAVDDLDDLAPLHAAATAVRSTWLVLDFPEDR
jgi:transglutaminase-like putative cysteine protease